MDDFIERMQQAMSDMDNREEMYRTEIEIKPEKGAMVYTERKFWSNCPLKDELETYEGYRISSSSVIVSGVLLCLKPVDANSNKPNLIAWLGVDPETGKIEAHSIPVNSRQLPKFLKVSRWFPGPDTETR